LLNEEQFIAGNQSLNYRYGLIFGFFIALIAYNSILFAGLKKRSYLYYSLYLSSLILLMFSYTGHGIAWLWTDQPLLQRYVVLGLMVLYGCCGLLFASRFLTLAEHGPRTLNIVRLTALLSISLFALCLLIDSHLGAVVLAFSFIAVFILMMIVLGILSIRKGQMAGRYFLLATLCGMLGTVITSLAVLGWLPFNAWTFYGLDYGAILDGDTFIAGLDLPF